MRGRVAALLLSSSLIFVAVGGSVSSAGPMPTPGRVQPLAGPRSDGPKGRQRPKLDETSVLVRFEPSRTSAAARMSVAAEHGLQARRTVGHGGFVELSTGGRPASAVRQELQHDPRVVSVEPNFIRTTMSDPNDPLFAQQWPLRAARFPEAWGIQPSAPDVTVAVVDTGVDLDHPDLFDQLVPGWDVVGNDSYPQDENGHGTMVAGIIGATANNGRGVAGGAYRARIQPIRVLGADGSGTDANVIEGITWAADHGANVINLSLGGPEPGSALAGAVAYAQAKGALVIAASGNTGGPEPIYPAALPGVLAVSATDNNGRLAWFSSHGPWVSLAAGGVDVTSTTLGAGTADTYASGTGTSFSSPLVAAAAALLRQAHPDWTAEQVSRRLTSTARDAGPPGHDDAYGFGLLDINAALGAARQDPVAPEPEDVREPNPVPEQASLFTGVATATTAPEEDVDWFALDVATPRWLTVNVTPPAGSAWQKMDPTVSVLGPAGGEVAAIDAAGPGAPEKLVFQASATGRYRVRIANYNASVSAGTYTVDVSSSSSPPAAFAPFQAYRTGSWPESTSIADLTGDGRGDVVMTTTYYFDAQNDYSIFVFPQLPDGSLGPPAKYHPSGTGSMVAATGDLDTDGDADLAVATSAGVEVFLQTAGVLVGPTVVPFSSVPSQVVVADVDGDGRKDLVAETANGVEVGIRAGGGWLPPALITADTGNEVEVGDVNGDGRADVVLTRSDCPPSGTCTAGVSTYLQRPGGGFAKEHHPTIHGYWPGVDGAAIGDVNGDGRNDVTVTIGGNSPGSRINTFYQQPDGTLGPAQVKLLYDIPEPIEAGDVNGDGRVDLVTAHGGWNAIGTIPQQPDGTLGQEILSGAPYASHYNMKGLALGDLDGRPGLDVALADYNNGLVVYRQAQSTPTNEVPWVYGTSPLDGLTTVSTTAPMTVTFGRPMDASSLTAATTALLDGSSLSPVPSTRAYDPAARRLTVTPSQPLLPGTPYQLVVTEVRDSAGMSMASREVVRVRTLGTPPPPPPPAPPTTTSTSTSTTSPTGPTTSTTAAPPPTPRSGYWMLGSAGAVYSFGQAFALGSATVPAAQVATSIAVTPSGNGYWVVTSTGVVSAFGDAAQLGGGPVLRPGEVVTSISAKPTGGGYWLFTSLGRAFAYGTAAQVGDLGSSRLNGPVMGSVATPSGLGYYMVAADGGIFAFGDARFSGSMGGRRLNAPVMGLAPDPDGVGYWLVAADGGIFAFDSGFRGSMGGARLNKPVIGMVAYGDGYLMVASDGGIFDFSSKPFAGSLGGSPPANPIVAVGPLNR